MAEADRRDRKRRHPAQRRPTGERCGTQLDLSVSGPQGMPEAVGGGRQAERPDRGGLARLDGAQRPRHGVLELPLLEGRPLRDLRPGNEHQGRGDREDHQARPTGAVSLMTARSRRRRAARYSAAMGVPRATGPRAAPAPWPPLRQAGKELPWPHNLEDRSQGAASRPPNSIVIAGIVEPQRRPGCRHTDRVRQGKIEAHDDPVVHQFRRRIFRTGQITRLARHVELDIAFIFSWPVCLACDDGGAVGNIELAVVVRIEGQRLEHE